MALLLTLTFDDVDVYDARSSYWTGRILAGIAGGESLYMAERAERPWGFDLVCDAADGGRPLCVRFANGTAWSFCAIPQRLREVQWPLFLADATNQPHGGDGGGDGDGDGDGGGGKKPIRVRVERIFSDSFHMDLVSENAVLPDLLVWRVPPKPTAAV